jgi:hypothetical protein
MMDTFSSVEGRRRVCNDQLLHLAFVFNGILYTPRRLKYIFIYNNLDCDHSF